MHLSPKISVIIPTYNRELYVGQTLESVINQNLNDLEVLVIDDGSTDSTRDIVKQYCEKDRRVHLYIQHHKGSGPARNLGIRKSKGKYLAFMDSDDLYPSNDVLSYMYSKSESSNCPICGGSLGYLKDNDIVVDFDKVSKYHSPKAVNRQERIYSSMEFQCELFYVRFLFLRDFIVNNGLSFPDLLRGQDMVFMAKAMYLSKNIYCFSRTVYIYRISHKTIVWDYKKIRDMIRAEKFLIDYGTKNKLTYIVVRAVSRLARMYYQYYFGINTTNRLGRELNSVIISAKNKQLKGLKVKLWKKYHFLDYKEHCFDDLFYELKNKSFDNIFVYCANDIGWYIYNKLKILGLNVRCIFDKSADSKFKHKKNCPIKVFDSSKIDFLKKMAFIVSTDLYFDEISAYITTSLKDADVTIYKARSFPSISFPDNNERE